MRLARPPRKTNTNKVECVLACARVKLHLFDEFKTHYQKAHRTDVDEAAEKAKEGAAAESVLPGAQPAEPSEATPGAGSAPAVSPEAHKSAFRKDIEAQISMELDRRMVVLTKDGQHEEVGRSVAATELYQKLEKSAGALRRNLRR